MASVSQDEPADDFEGAIASARQDLQLAIAKAHLTDDPLGVALHAMSETLGAQAALYKATFNKYRDISADLDRARSDAVEAGRLELEGQKAGIVQELAPQLLKLTASQVKVQERTVKLKTLLMAGGIAGVLAITAACVGYGTGWKNGRTNGLYDKGALFAALQEHGPGAETALIELVRNNDIPAVLSACRAHAFDQGGRQACAAPLWLEPPRPPAAQDNK
ncbi:hypothetical protein K6L44_01370 [Gluconacetobacter entanii]|jgi:hypothetical protein|nr:MULTISPECIES: hypothetical protein [Acetobacteraceae]GBO79769.1 hypothetical protein AA0242T_0471 [Acetobacter aceti NRIC 0242]KXV19347.1 hypothetical protein AD933_01925 [Acetobacter malorum]KXV29457.1 hypothetical protein AD937_00650 [Gluconobacter japonicus]KXV54305.1 hypothetical protein AD946_03550 [Gluconobacter thailandicus]KXV61002.1 hypothetical protein AD947_01350 [Acetobacter tropicalis]